MIVKPIIWTDSARVDLKAFPTSVQGEIGYQLFKLQCGVDPDDWKPMTGIGTGVKEIRVRDRSGAFRVIYLAVRSKGIYVLHCFQKKTQKTSLNDLRVAQQRFKDLPR